MPAGTDALPAQSFTPLLGTLLLSPNVSISASTRQCIVQLVQRIRNLAQRDETIGSFGVNERQILEKEILDQLVIGMAHLELDSDAMGLYELPLAPLLVPPSCALSFASSSYLV